jgi:cytochrome c peroxidase
MRTILSTIFFCLILGSCDKDIEIKYTYYEEDEKEILSKYFNLEIYPSDYEIDVPAHLFSEFGYLKLNDRELALLGRALFYDKKLSRDSSLSCSSCHKQEFAFGDNTKFSKLGLNRNTNRNTIALGTSSNYRLLEGQRRENTVNYFHDLSVNSLGMAITASFNKADHMNIDMEEVVRRVNSIEYYKILNNIVNKYERNYLFQRDTTNITLKKERIIKAISDFIYSMNDSSKWDIALNSYFKNKKSFDSISEDDFTTFTQTENNGKRVYMKNCSSCHGTLFEKASISATNNGLSNFYLDLGVGAVTKNGFEDGHFKTPNLRNVFYTSPYMHNGSLETIDQVLDHYEKGIMKFRNLDKQLIAPNNVPKKIVLSTKERIELKSFLTTLTDQGLLQDKRFSDPFRK